jgi:beta-lactamase superfamily II metal-dependent hydrolase
VKLPMPIEGRTLPPSQDEIEVSLFGPGIGESIVVHLGDNRWAVVDSCIDDATGNPVALDYLQSLGVDISSQVELIVITHWHDDHIQGMGEIVRRAASSTVYFSVALRNKEFFSLVGAAADDPIMEGSGVREFDAVRRIMEERAIRSGNKTKYQAVGSNAILWSRPRGQGKDQVVSLSPSPDAIFRGYREIASRLPLQYAPKRRLLDRSPNETSVVTHVLVGEAVCILGGDLQESGTPVHGWTDILNSAPRPPERAQVFKVAHHGSENADHENVWAVLLDEHCIAIVTPFTRSDLPTERDQERIRARSSVSYITNPHPQRKLRGVRDARTERILRSRKHKIEPASGDMGQIRLRRSIDANAAWQVETFGTASAL